MQRLKDYNIDYVIVSMRQELANPTKETGGILEYFKNKAKFGVFTKSRAYFEFLKNTILKSNNIEHLIKLAQADLPHVSFKEIERIVKKSHNPDWYVKFVKNFPEVRRDEYEAFILNSRDVDACTNYAIYCNPSDVISFQDVVCSEVDNYENRKNLIYFFKHVKGADRTVVGKTFIDSYFNKRMEKSHAYPQGHTKEGVVGEMMLLFDNSKKRKEGILESPPIIPMSLEQRQYLESTLKQHINNQVSYYEKTLKTK